MPNETKTPQKLRGLFMRFYSAAFMAALLLTSPAHAEVIHSHAISVFGDIKYPRNFKHFDYVNPDAPKGGTMTLPAIGNFDNLNPFILKGRSAAELAILFDTLMVGADDETATAYGLIAESASYDSENKWVIFYLRPEAKFSDGSALTADDVVFTFNILKEQGHPFYKLLYTDVSSAEKLGTYTVKFNFSNPKNRELKLLVSQLPVLSKKYYETNTFDKTTLKAPLGSGPYVVEKVEQGRSIVYKRNPDYWAKDLPVNKGKYNFDRFRHEYYFDAYVAIQALKSGAVDLRYENIAKNWANAYNIPQVRDGRIIKEMIKHEIPQGIQGFALNTRKAKFANRDVREALTLTMDFEWMNNNIFYGSYFRTNSYFSNSIYASSGVPEGKELALLEKYRGRIPDEIFTQEYKLPVSDGSGRIRDRLQKARELLKRAGWELNEKGILVNAEGRAFTIDFLIDNGSTFERLLPGIMKNLEVLGIQSRIQEVDVTQYQKRIEKFDFDMVVGLWPSSLSPGNELMNYWHSSSADIQGSRNLSGVKNPVVDALVGRIMKAKDKETVVTATHALDRVLLWNYYVIPQWYLGSFRLVYWDKFGKPEVMPKYDPQFGLYNWWAKKIDNKTN